MIEGLDDIKSMGNRIKKIEFCDVGIQFPDSKEHLLTKVNFTINEGEKVAIIGEKGRGKSTILNLLLGIYVPTEGKVLINGMNLQKLNKVRFRKEIGVVRRDAFLFNKTIYENIRNGKKEIDKEQVIEATRRTNIHMFIQQLPEQYETEITDLGLQFAGNKRERIVLARTILQKYPVIITDTIIDNMENEEMYEIIDYFLKSNCTYIMLSKYDDKVNKFDKIIKIVGKRVLVENRK